MSRVQLALNVNDIDEAVSFYRRLFGATAAARTEPASRRLRLPLRPGKVARPGWLTGREIRCARLSGRR